MLYNPGICWMFGLNLNISVKYEPSEQNCPVNIDAEWPALSRLYRGPCLSKASQGPPSSVGLISVIRPFMDTLIPPPSHYQPSPLSFSPPPLSFSLKVHLPPPPTLPSFPFSKASLSLSLSLSYSLTLSCLSFNFVFTILNISSLSSTFMYYY